MNLKAFLKDNSAVSPVIGVILMVAITVILAAVIGTFVLGLGDRVSQAQPNAQFSFEYGTNDGGEEVINITHDGGDGVEAEQLEVQIGGTTAWNGTNDYAESGDFIQAGGEDNWINSKITAGDTLDIQDNGADVSDGDTVQVIWTASGSDKTAVIGESEVSL